jgi:hypothetical protein
MNHPIFSNTINADEILLITPASATPSLCLADPAAPLLTFLNETFSSAIRTLEAPSVSLLLLNARFYSCVAPLHM